MLKDMRECEMVRDRNALPNANINGVSLRPTMGSKLPRPVFKIFGEFGVYKFLRYRARLNRIFDVGSDELYKPKQAV